MLSSLNTAILTFKYLILFSINQIGIGGTTYDIKHTLVINLLHKEEGMQSLFSIGSRIKIQRLIKTFINIICRL